MYALNPLRYSPTKGRGKQTRARRGTWIPRFPVCSFSAELRAYDIHGVLLSHCYVLWLFLSWRGMLPPLTLRNFVLARWDSSKKVWPSQSTIWGMLRLHSEASRSATLGTSKNGRAVIEMTMLKMMMRTTTMMATVSHSKRKESTSLTKSESRDVHCGPVCVYVGVPRSH